MKYCYVYVALLLLFSDGFDLTIGFGSLFSFLQGKIIQSSYVKIRINTSYLLYLILIPYLVPYQSGQSQSCMYILNGYFSFSFSCSFYFYLGGGVDRGT
jgi:hypothetical protein